FARFVITLLAPYRKTIIWCSALAFVAAGMGVLSPIALGRAIDAAGKDVGPWTIVAGIAAWLALGHGAERLHMLLYRRGNDIAYETVSRFKLEAVAMLLRKPLSFHYGQRGGDVTEKMSKFEEEVNNVITGVVFDLAPTAISVLSILGYLAFLDGRIALLLALTVGAVVYDKIRTLPAALKSQAAWRASAREVSSTAWDAVKNILVVKSTSSEKRLSARLEDLRTAMLKDVRFDNVFDERQFNRQNLIIQGGSALVLLIALLNVHAGVFTFGRFTAVSALTISIFGYVRWVQWQMRNLTRATATYKDVRGMLEQPEEDYASGKALDLKGAIAFRDVRYRYRPDVPVIEDVSFAVAPGERVALVGESGEGKTTLIDLIGRYHLPQAGAIAYDGVDAADVNLVSLRAQIGLVPQDLPMLHESIGENIRYGRPDATDEEVREAARLASLDAFIAALPDGYATVVGERGLKLSGGQRQRVALARAFLRNPKILILDEPTSNLDSKTEEEIQRSLETLMKGRTTFIIAHRLRTVRDADRILVLKGGRIVEQGRHEELVAKNGAYAALLRSQTGLVAPDEAKGQGTQAGEDEETAE
ncbi:MAG TPA: ABC transporter ATP-binding protein, partial [Patescibacteria group bacterium]|nr:ABC transporter ATP-binding protein [Patescibacteria group bacterium]